MALDLIIYAPGSGGNHVKNLLCLSQYYANSSDLDTRVYDFADPERPPGEVWCRGGRNLQQIYFDAMAQAPDQHWVLPAHFGEIMQFATQLASVHSKRVVLIGLEHEPDRRRLEQRQCRLGQNIHPYWLDEELTWLYRADVLSRLSNIPNQKFLSIDLGSIWHHGFVCSREFSELQSFLGVNIPNQQAQQLHHKWVHANFGHEQGLVASHMDLR